MGTYEKNIQKNIRQYIEKAVDDILSKDEQYNSVWFMSNLELNHIVNDITKSKEIHYLTENVVRQNDCLYDDEDKGDFFLDDFSTNMDDLYSFLAKHKSANYRLKGLEVLVDCPLSEITDRKHWPRLSKLLRDYLIGKHEELFVISYKIHMKLIFHPQSWFDGMTNLIKILTVVFQSQKLYIPTNHMINLNIPIHKQILKIIHILLKGLNHFQRNYKINYKQKDIDDLIVSFMELVTFHTYTDKMDRLCILNYISVIDPKANWFFQFTYNTLYRTIVMSFLKKKTSFTKFIVSELLMIINYHENEFNLKYIAKMEFREDIVRLASLSHCSNILCNLLTCRQGQELFPLQTNLNNKPVNVHNLIVHLLETTNNFENLPYQRQKRNILINLIKKVLIKSKQLLLNPDILQKLLSPFVSHTQKYTVYDIACNNMHIFHICNHLSQIKGGFLILYGFDEDLLLKNNLKFSSIKKTLSPRDKEYATPVDIITSFTVSVLRFYIHKNGKLQKDELLLHEMLNCCGNILTMLDNILYWLNCQKLITAAVELYKMLIRAEWNSAKHIQYLTNFLVQICSVSSGMDYLRGDSEILYLLSSNLFSMPGVNFWIHKYFYKFMFNLTQNMNEYHAIHENKKILLSYHLDKIWKLAEDQHVYLKGSERIIDDEVTKYMQIIFFLSCSLNCAHIFATESEDDATTLVDTEHKPFHLYDLFDDTLNSSSLSFMSFIGLSTLRMLIVNLNVYLFLEYKFNIQERILSLQEECQLPIDYKLSPKENLNQPSMETCIIDECSLLRQQISSFIQNIGLYNFKPCFSNQGQEANAFDKKPKSGSRSKSARTLSELQRFLRETKDNLHDNGWLIHVRRIYKTVLGYNLKEPVLMELIRQVRQVYPEVKSGFVWPSSDAELKDLHPEELTGITVVIRFGSQNKLVPTYPGVENLAILLKQVHAFLNTTEYTYNGFDWFAATIFLMCAGSIEKSRQILQAVAELPVGPYIWPALCNILDNQRKDKFISCLDNCLNTLLQENIKISIAAESACILWRAISDVWLNQFFFNILEWNDLCHYLALTVLYTPDYVLFFIVSAVQFMEKTILKNTTSNSESKQTIYRKILQLEDFHLKDVLPVLESLAKQYKNVLIVK